MERARGWLGCMLSTAYIQMMKHTMAQHREFVYFDSEKDPHGDERVVRVWDLITGKCLAGYARYMLSPLERARRADRQWRRLCAFVRLTRMKNMAIALKLLNKSMSQAERASCVLAYPGAYVEAAPDLWRHEDSVDLFRDMVFSVWRDTICRVSDRVTGSLLLARCDKASDPLYCHAVEARLHPSLDVWSGPVIRPISSATASAVAAAKRKRDPACSEPQVDPMWWAQPPGSQKRVALGGPPQQRWG